MSEHPKMDHTNIRVKKRALDRDTALKVVDKSIWGAVSMCTPDGTPYNVALNLVRDGEKLYFHAAQEGLKVDILRQNPKVCVLFVPKAVPVPEGFTTHYASAVVRGTAQEVTDLEEKTHALRVICAVFSPDFPEETERRIANGAAHTTGIWRIDIESVSGKASPPGVID
ncbi:MAG: pyridoxamine 5'-phosphate oxidase family protein [Clostridia bacterium]|nr:pyridoxamine 5'-phosphate oxidase family protein [Clostridia bacterium]